MSMVKSASSEDLLGFISENIKQESHIITDGWSGYSKVKDSGYKHTVQSLGKYQEVIPHVHLVVSLIKRWLLGTLQGGISKEQLEYYLDEFVFRFNRRTSKKRTLIFHRLIEGSIESSPAPFKVIARHQEKASRNKPNE